ncbi:MAG: transcription elongation factor GreB [Bdellovibrio sp. CG10_big_fil_rev_8_21_14_0_10_47_8]|nr:MAG: transcription elongation factor GreB [Bdellovibrio sp. CG10_big_fil_rev_8_21_14_0_10_47_8]
MSDEKNYITCQGVEKLRSEYAELFHNERPKLVEVIAWAASNGDRSENADYIYGKRRLREIDSRLRFLSNRLERAFVVDPTTLTGKKIVFGATVTLLDEDEIKTVYQIVGEDESNVSQGKISWKSPVAKALLGKTEGDEVTVIKPAGEEIFLIDKVEFK